MGGRTVAATLNYSESARDVTATLPLTIRIYNVTRRVKIQDIALEGIDVQYCAGVVIRRSKVLRSGSKRALEASQSASIRARMWPASVGNAVG
jgi:Cyclophilin-like family